MDFGDRASPIFAVFVVPAGVVVPLGAAAGASGAEPSARVAAATMKDGR